MVATPTLLPPPSSLWEDTTQDVISGGTTINWGQAVSSQDPHGMLTKTQEMGNIPHKMMQKSIL